MRPTVPDNQMTEPIHAHLDRKGLLPAKHLMDSGYPSAELLVSSQADYGVALVTPLLAGTSPQARAGAGYVRSPSAAPTDTIVITFAKAICGPCPARDLCTTAASGRRQLTVHPREAHQAQLTARASQDITDFQARYALRADVEGTIRQGVAVTGMLRARYRGLRPSPAGTHPLPLASRAEGTHWRPPATGISPPVM